MTRHARLGLFLTGGAGLAALLLWGFAGLPAFGHYHGVYGLVLNRDSLGQTHAMNTIAAVTFDYRGFDTMGEEFILFASVMGVALLLREVREREAKDVHLREPFDPVRATGVVAVPVFFLLGLFVIAHGYLTPGGGFQGGVVVAMAIVLVSLAADHAAYRSLARKSLTDLLEGIGAGAYVAVGVGGLVAGAAFLESFVPRGKIGTLTSSGTIGLLNWASGIEVAAAMLLLLSEFFEEVIVEHGARRKR
jgi:multicomponent Na+:H+ antiporter subunit B